MLDCPRSANERLVLQKRLTLLSRSPLFNLNLTGASTLTYTIKVKLCSPLRNLFCNKKIVTVSDALVY